MSAGKKGAAARDGSAALAARPAQAEQRAAQAGLDRAARARVAAETIIAGTKEVLFPILATTVTTMVAFLSFIFLSGRLALYYVPLAISIATAMFASVFVAFGWIPVVLNQLWVPRLLRCWQRVVSKSTSGRSIRTNASAAAIASVAARTASLTWPARKKPRRGSGPGC